MNEQHTTGNPRIWAALGAVGASAVLGLGLLLGNLGPEPARAAAVTPVPGKTITVAGMGEVKVQPDMAYLNFNIHVPGATADEALAAYEKAATTLTTRLHALGIADSDLVLNPASTWPAQPEGMGVMPATRPGAEPGTPVGYYSDGMVSVTVHDLAKLRDVAMEGLKSSTGIGLGGIQYALQNDSAARTQALNRAIDNARTQADAVAAKLGLKVQDVAAVTVQPNMNGPVPMMAGGKGGMAAGMDPGANFAPLGSRPDIVVNLVVEVSYNFQ
jgi:uncharacterized protein YggE